MDILALTATAASSWPGVPGPRTPKKVKPSSSANLLGNIAVYFVTIIVNGVSYHNPNNIDEEHLKAFELLGMWILVRHWDNNDDDDAKYYNYTMVTTTVF